MQQKPDSQQENQDMDDAPPGDSAPQVDTTAQQGNKGCFFFFISLPLYPVYSGLSRQREASVKTLG